MGLKVPYNNAEIQTAALAQGRKPTSYCFRGVIKVDSWFSFPQSQTRLWTALRHPISSC